MKKAIKSALVALTVITPVATKAALIVDTFSSDTSANYTGTNSVGSGGSFNVSGGTLNLTNTALNSYSAFHNTAQLETGEFVRVSVPFGTSRDFYLSISTTTSNPAVTGTSGIRYNLNIVSGNSAFRTRTYRDGAVTDSAYTTISSWTEDLTLYIYRDTNTTYRVGYDTGSGVTETGSAITLNQTDEITGMFIGVEGYSQSTTITRKFDNLEIAAIPEPASAALMCLGGITLLLRRRR